MMRDETGGCGVDIYLVQLRLKNTVRALTVRTTTSPAYVYLSFNARVVDSVVTDTKGIPRRPMRNGGTSSSANVR